MAYKYKLKEEPFNVGDVETKRGVKTTVKDIDPETGSVSWKVEYVPAFDTTFKEFQELRQSLKKLAQKAGDQTIDSLSNNVSNLFNQYRTYIRKNYPDEYKKVVNEEEIDEMSTTGGGAGSASFNAGTGMQYATPYAFKKQKKKLKKEGVGATLGPGPKATEDGVKDNAYVKQFKYKLVPKNKNGTYVQKGSELEVDKLF